MRPIKYVIQNVGIFLTLLFFLASCVVQKNPVTGKKRAYGFTWKEGVQIGKQADIQIQEEYGIYNDPELNKYVNDIGQKVLAKSHLQRSETDAVYRETPFTFRVLNSPIVNAFALPGGYIYVTRGLLAYLDNEAQLAVILGHEIGHVAARHAAQKTFQEKVGQIALLGGAIAGEQILGISSQDILNIGGTATQLLFLRYSRDDERESDRLGVEYAGMAGYNSSEASKFFIVLRRMSQQQGNNLPSLLSTHPDPGDREKAILNLSAQWRNKGYSMNVIDQKKYLKKIDGIIFGINPREGFVENGVFYHPDLQFQFPVPNNWNMNNQASRVIFTSEDQHSILIMQTDNTAGSPQNSVTQFFNRIQGAKVIESKSLGNQSIPAYQATATIPAQNNEEVQLFIYAADFDKKIYQFIGLSSPKDFGNYEPVFKRASYGFAKLTDKRISNIRPHKIHVIAVGSKSTFDNFITGKKTQPYSSEELAILNQVNLRDTLPSGRLIKIPEQE